MRASQHRWSGWWEQAGYGRQAMHDLALQVAGGAVDGSGVDVVGRFLLDGALERDGTVEITKRYVGRHVVLYRGWHDGEGRMWGHWALWGWSGRWLIVMGRDEHAPDDELSGLVSVEPASRPDPSRPDD